MFDIAKYPKIAIDTETTGLSVQAGHKAFGISISTCDSDFYWDIREEPDIPAKLAQLLEHYNGKVVCHNLSFDYQMLKTANIHLDLTQCEDTGILACLINEHEFTYSLDHLAKKYAKHKKGAIEVYEQLAKLYGGRATKNVQMPRLHQAPVEIVAPYAMDDTKATLSLHDWQEQQISKQDLHQIVAFEKALTPVIIKAEMRGVRVDTDAAEQAVMAVDQEVQNLQKELNDIAGFRCNPQPSGDMKKLFKPVWKDGNWWANDGSKLPSTDAGGPSLGADSLRDMKHPAAALIVELRSLIKTRDTFLMGHILESAHNGRVYPSIHQNKGESGGTGTGRLAYSGPALQQIPDRNKKIAEIVKKVFLPEEGHSWVDMDEASFEVRIFAHLVATKEIIDAYTENPETDFHQFVADLTGLVRNATYNGQPNAKQLNLSAIFNSGDGAIADAMGLPWEWQSFVPKGSSEEVTYKRAGPEAMAVIEKYHQKLPGVKRLAEKCKVQAEQLGFLCTALGRKLRFPNKRFSYKASGILIQATSADENKRNWMQIDDALKGTDAVMLLNTHDSYSLSIPIGEEETVCKKVKERLEEDRGLNVPLILEVNRPGKNWWDSKSSERWM